MRPNPSIKGTSCGKPKAASYVGLPNLAYLSESRAYVLVAGFRCSRFDCSAHNFGIRSVLLIMAEPLTR